MQTQQRPDLGGAKPARPRLAAALIAVLGAGAGFAQLGGCEQPAPEQDLCPGSWCQADPLPHCLDPEFGCRDDEDCPQGTACLGTEPSEMRCQVPLGTESYRSVLTEGFDVGEFPRANLTNVLDWRAPDRSRVVTCGTFTCPPVIREGPDGRATIVNYDRCVTARLATTEHEGSFDPLDPQRAHEPSKDALEALAPGCDSVTNEAVPQAASILAVGCWAYDDGRLIAATKLLDLDFGEVHDTKQQLARGLDGSCTAEDDGRSCRLDTGELSGFGVCIGLDSCALRCLDASDCKRQCEAAHPTETTFADFECTPSAEPTNPLGVCAPCLD